MPVKSPTRIATPRATPNPMPTLASVLMPREPKDPAGVEVVAEVMSGLEGIVEKLPSCSMQSRRCLM